MEYQEITIEIIEEMPEFKHLTDEEACQIVNSIKELANILVCGYFEEEKRSKNLTSCNMD